MYKDIFKKRLDEEFKFDEIKKEYVKMTDDDHPIEDDKGRQTFFYVKLGEFEIPVYMPGTFMFNGVKDGGDLAIYDYKRA